MKETPAQENSERHAAVRPDVSADKPAFKAWLWDHEHTRPEFIMLIVEDAEGNRLGLTFSGQRAHDQAVSNERQNLERDGLWRRIA